MRQIFKQFDDIDHLMQGIEPHFGRICLRKTFRSSPDITDTFASEDYRRRVSFRLGPFQRVKCITRMISAFFRHRKQSMEDKKKANQEYFKNKTAYMLQFSVKQIELYSAEVIFEFLCETYLPGFEFSLDCCMSAIPEEIKAQHKLIENIVNEQRDCETLIQEYSPIEKECKDIMKSLLYFKLKYLSGCPPLILKEKDELGHGSYATVHLCEVDIGGETLNCAVKRQRLHLYSDAYIQLSEADTMR